MASERMALVYEKLFHAVCDQNMNKVVNAIYEIFGMPVLFVDEYFHVVSMQPAGATGDREWDEIHRTMAMNQAEVFEILDEFLSGQQAFYQPFYAATGTCAHSPKVFAEVVREGRIHVLELSEALAARLSEADDAAQAALYRIRSRLEDAGVGQLTD